jgi:hypothetical protein
VVGLDWIVLEKGLNLGVRELGEIPSDRTASASTAVEEVAALDEVVSRETAAAVVRFWVRVGAMLTAAC